MDTQKIWMTGITGFVGRYLANHLASCPGTRLLGVGRVGDRPEGLPDSAAYERIDLTNPTALAASIEAYRPHWVVHSGAISRPNDAAQQPELAYQVNVEATAAIAAACKRTGSTLLFLSSDMVFGHQGPYTETDEPCPVNVYGQTKAAAEAAILKEGVAHLIIRTVLVYGTPLQQQGATFVQWVANQLRKGQPIQVYTDQQRTVTYIKDLISGIGALMHAQQRGIFHVCGGEVWTPFDMACQVATHLGLPNSLIIPVTTAERPEPAIRPAASTLSIHKITKAVSYQPTALQEALHQIFPLLD